MRFIAQNISIKTQIYILLATLTFGLTIAGNLATAEESSTYVPVKLIKPLETSIPANLKQLHILNPRVKFHVIVDTEGNMADYLAVEGTHYLLLEKAEQRLQEARFEPATNDGVPATGYITVIVTFYDPEQRSWRNSSGMAPLGGSVSDAVEHKLYKANPDRYAYKESSPKELDSPLKIIESKFIEIRNPDGELPKGKVVVEYFVDHEGRVRLPKVISSDNKFLSMSALQTLNETRFAPPHINEHPTYVRVKQPFNFN